jgi:hypothetical protein
MGENSNSENYARMMKESREELVNLKVELQNLMVKFGLRALKLYQTGRNEPLKPIELASLVKYELDNAIGDLAETESIDAIIKQTKNEWTKQHEKPQVFP